MEVELMGVSASRLIELRQNPIGLTHDNHTSKVLGKELAGLQLRTGGHLPRGLDEPA